MAQEDVVSALTRRKLFTGALATAALADLLARSAPVEAQLIGLDEGELGAILTQAIATASGVASLVIQTANQVRLMVTLLGQVSSGSFPALIAFIGAARSTYSSLTWGIRSMSYQLARIDSEFSSLFPGGTPPRGTTVAQHRTQVQSWNQEVVGASQVAARQQTALSTLDDNAKQTQSVLQQSQTASGEIAQLQLIAQMIGITNSELIVLNQTLATTGRVLTDLAAQGASERQLSVGKSDDARSGYTDKGSPVTVPSTLP
jgi:hypothetical protein